jgi:hypothetical protein
MHRLPLVVDSTKPTVFVRTAGGVVDAREASDIIAKLSGNATWRKLYLRRDTGRIQEAREHVKLLSRK